MVRDIRRLGLTKTCLIQAILAYHAIVERTRAVFMSANKISILIVDKT